MTIPKWAPRDIVIEYRRYLTEDELSREFLREEKQRVATVPPEEWKATNVLTKPAYFRDFDNWYKNELERLAFYRRLIYDSRSKDIWEALERNASRQTCVTCKKTFHLMYAHRCWLARQAAINRPKDTPREKREKLQRIVTLAKELRIVLSASPYFDDRWFIAEQMTGEKIAPNYYGTAYAKAMLDWRNKRSNSSKLDALSRTDSHWLLGLYNNLTLGQILRWLHDDATMQSKSAPIVKQAKSSRASRNYFALLLRDFHEQLFKRPLSKTIELVTNVTLDLSDIDAITDADVRALVRARK